MSLTLDPHLAARSIDALNQLIGCFDEGEFDDEVVERDEPVASIKQCIAAVKNACLDTEQLMALRGHVADLAEWLDGYEDEDGMEAAEQLLAELPEAT
jgi:hypothetical protein